MNIKSLDYNNINGYTELSGTSQATPCVAGIVALMLSKNPELTPAQICQILEETSVKLTPTKSNITGVGRVDALAAVNAVPEWTTVNEFSEIEENTSDANLSTADNHQQSGNNTENNITFAVIKSKNMKRITFAIILACCTLTLAAQDAIKVNYQGEKPTISDFAWALLSNEVEADDEEEAYADESFNAFKQAWIRHREGLPQEEGNALTIDEKNGFVLYEFTYEKELLKIEMCFWNEADKQHKLIAYNVRSFSNGKYSTGQFDVLSFYRYDNNSKQMTPCYDFGFDVEYSTDDGAWVSYALPQTGKNISVTYWYDNGKTEQKTLKWDGRRFGF